MNRLSKILTLVLALQLLLVAAVFWPRTDAGEGTARAPLLEFEAASIDRIALSDSEGGVAISRGKSGWQLPDYHDLPVDATKLNRVLEDLPRLARGWPVASSAGASERFEVAGDNFQRRVDYSGGDEAKGSLYLGTSPGFRKVHIRIAGDDPVYAVEFNSFDLPVEPAEWLDKTLLRVATPSAISGRDYQLSREGEAWLGRGQAQPASAEVDKLVNGLTSLRVTAVADIALAAELEQMEVAPTLSVSSAGEIYEYRLYEMEDERYIKRSDIPVYFSFSQFDYDRLNEVNAASLYPAPETEEAPAAETAETDAD